MRSPQRLARIAGVCYLLCAVFALFAHWVGTEADAPGDAAATARNVAAHPTLFRLGVIADLAQAVAILGTALALYLLLSHIDTYVARTMVIFVVIMVTITLANSVHYAGAHLVATDGSYAAALGSSGADALVGLLFDLHRHGVLVAKIFFGLWLLPLGYLVARSGRFPRVLGILLMTVGCGGYLVDLLARLLAPEFGAALSPFVVTPAGIVEFAMIGWLLVKRQQTAPGLAATHHREARSVGLLP